MIPLVLVEISDPMKSRIPLGFRKIYFRPLGIDEVKNSMPIEFSALSGEAPCSERPTLPISKIILL